MRWNTERCRHINKSHMHTSNNYIKGFILSYVWYVICMWCSCVFIFVCVHMCISMRVWTHVALRSAVGVCLLQGISPPPPTSWDKISHWSWNLWIDSASMADWWSPGIFLALQKWERRDHLFYMDAGNLKLGPPAELSPQPHSITILKLFRSVMKVFSHSVLII